MTGSFDITIYDEFREGANIRTDKQRFSRKFTIAIGSNRDDHEIVQLDFGQPSKLKDSFSAYVDNHQRFDPFNPVQFLSEYSGGEMFPFSLGGENDLSGSIERITIRDEITIQRRDGHFYAKSVKADLEGGNKDFWLKDEIISQFIPFDRASVNLPFSDNSIVTYGFSEASTGMSSFYGTEYSFFYGGDESDIVVGGTVQFASQSFVNQQDQRVIRFFDDSVPEALFSGAPDSERLTGDSIMDAALRLMTGSYDLNFIPKRHKSAKAGFIYNNNSAIGTDSIAFGGLKKGYS